MSRGDDLDNDTPGVHVTDAELLRRYSEGDVAAFDGIVERYEGRLLRYAAGYRPHEAQDIVQEAFLRLLKEVRHHGSRRDGVGNLQAWLYRVTRNLAIDEARKERRMERRHRLAAAREVAEPPPTGVEAREATEVVAARLRNLPPRERDVLILKIHERKSYREISEITGLSTSNVGYLIHQGLKTLAGELRTAGIV